MMAELTLVLLHSPLVGPLTWTATAECLRREGLPTAVPTLVLDGDPPYYRRVADSTAAAVATIGTPLVLVAHSAAGAFLPPITEAIGNRVRAMIFVDALLPHPGLSSLDSAPPQAAKMLTDEAGDGYLPPWHTWFPPGLIEELLPDPDLRHRFIAEIAPPPLAYFEEPAPETPGLPETRCAYLQLSQAYEGAADEAERRDWLVHRVNADHLTMLTNPEAIAELIGEITKTLVRD